MQELYNLPPQDQIFQFLRCEKILKQFTHLSFIRNGGKYLGEFSMSKFLFHRTDTLEHKCPKTSLFDIVLKSNYAD